MNQTLAKAVWHSQQGQTEYSIKQEIQCCFVEHQKKYLSEMQWVFKYLLKGMLEAEMADGL